MKELDNKVLNQCYAMRELDNTVLILSDEGAG